MKTRKNISKTLVTMAVLAMVAVWFTAGRAAAAVVFDGHTWYAGSGGASLAINGSGELEYTPAPDDIIYTNFAEQDLSNIGDIAKKSYRFKFASGGTSGQLRIGLFDAEGDAYRTSDGAGWTDAAWANNPTAADDYLGYQIRFNAPQPSTSSGFDNNFRKRDDNADGNLMQSSSRWDTISAPINGFDMTAGTFYDMELEAERTAASTVVFSTTFNGITRSFTDTTAAGQPLAIDAMAFYTNNTSNLGLITLAAIPEPSTFVLAVIGLLGLVGTRRRRLRCT